MELKLEYTNDFGLFQFTITYDYLKGYRGMNFASREQQVNGISRQVSVLKMLIK